MSSKFHNKQESSSAVKRLAGKGLRFTRSTAMPGGQPPSLFSLTHREAFTYLAVTGDGNLHFLLKRKKNIFSHSFSSFSGKSKKETRVGLMSPLNGPGE
jgi:hypothetical protein